MRFHARSSAAAYPLILMSRNGCSNCVCTAFEVVRRRCRCPRRADEAWRRTDIRRLKLDQIGPSLNGDAAGDVQHARLLGQAAHRGRGGRQYAAGRWRGAAVSALDPALVEQGVIFWTCTRPSSSIPELVQQLLHDRGVPASEGKFAALAWRVLARGHLPLCAQERRSGRAAAQRALVGERPYLHAHPGCSGAGRGSDLHG